MQNAPLRMVDVLKNTTNMQKIKLDFASFMNPEHHLVFQEGLPCMLSMS